MTSDYRPISCDLHSEYELLAMQRARVEVQLEGESQPLRVRVHDVVARAGAEYLIVETADGVRLQWRLDRLRGVRRLAAKAPR
jgi:Rho-binding antiterminator